MFMISLSYHQRKYFYLHFKDILSYRKSRKDFVESGESTEINIKSKSSVTTKTFINELTFVETEFLPTKPRRQRSIRVSQVNITPLLLLTRSEMFYWLFMAWKIFLQQPQENLMKLTIIKMLLLPA